MAVSRVETAITELMDGNFFGEMALLDDQVRTTTVTAKTASILLRLSRKDVLSFAESDPDLKLRLENAEDIRRASA